MLHFHKPGDRMTKPDPTVLLADDQADVREALRLLLKSDGVASVAADGPVAALDALRRREFACALIDLNYTRDTTSGEEGLDLLARLREQTPELPVVVMTAGAPPISSRSRGTTRACCACCVRRSLCPRARAGSAAWRPRTHCCAARPT